MLSFSSEILPTFLYMLIASLLGSIFIAISLLKAYDQFIQGVKENNRFRIWSAFFIVSFVLVLFVTFLCWKMH